MRGSTRRLAASPRASVTRLSGPSARACTGPPFHANPGASARRPPASGTRDARLSGRRRRCSVARNRAIGRHPRARGMDGSQHARPARTGDGGQVAGFVRQARACEPRETGRFDEVGIEAERGGRVDAHAGQFPSQRVHQCQVVHAAAAGVQLLHAAPMRAQRICDRARAEREQGRLHVHGCNAAGQARIEPVEIEHLAPGALRRRRGEIRIGQPVREQAGLNAAAARPGAAVVARAAEMACRPRVQQAVRRAAVEAEHVVRRTRMRRCRGYRMRRSSACVEHGDVRDAAEIEDRARYRRVGERRGVQRGQQRRALAAGGNIGAAEIRDGEDARAFGDHARVADLQRERMRAAWPMAHGLAVRADGADLRGIGARFAEQRQRGRRKAFADFDIESPEFVERNRRVAGRQRQHACMQVGRIRERACGENVDARLEAQQRRVDAIRAGTRDQAEPQRRGRRHRGFSLRRGQAGSRRRA